MIARWIATVVVALAACAPAASRPPTAALHVLPEAGPRPLLRSVESARGSVDLQMYLVSNPLILTALADARRRGVRVRALVEQEPFGGFSNAAAVEELNRAGVETRWSGPAFRLSHAKTVVIDRATAWVMTANMTRAAFGRNREYMAVLTDPTEVADLAAIFEADWHRVEHLPTAERLVVAPTNARDRLGELIRTAERSLDVEAEVLSDSATIRLLGEAAARGVAVRLVMSPDEFSQAGRAALARAGVQVRLLSDPFMHAKMILADGRRLYVGSVNLSAASLDRNREVGVILTERPVIQLAQRTFERDWSEARPSAER